MILAEFSYYPDQSLDGCAIILSVFLLGLSVHILFSPVTEYDIYNSYS